MKTWINPYGNDSAGLLDDLGGEEHYNMSKRILTRYSSLFSAPYNPNIYPITSTYLARTSSSASAFGFGIFEGKGKLSTVNFQPFAVLSTSANEDTILRFFDNCPTYVTYLKTRAATEEADKYLSQYSDSIYNKVKTILGLDTSVWNMTFNDVSVMFRVCKFEASMTEDLQHFCSLFDQNDFDVFEVFNDLSDYYKSGYGHPQNYQISCPLYNDFMTSIQSVINGSTSEVAKFRFAHAETIMPFVALLGLYNDSEILHWNSSNLNSRLWRTSKISPFAANVALALYNCNGVYKVKLLHNENQMAVPGCGGGYYCDVNTFTSIYSNYTTCAFTKLCGTTPSPKPTPNH